MISFATQRLTVSPETWQIRAISKVVNTVFFIFIMWTILNIFDSLVKSNKSDGTGKSSRCKACESLGMRRTHQYAAVIYPVKYVLCLMLLFSSGFYIPYLLFDMTAFNLTGRGMKRNDTLRLCSGP
jgi:hypothetical protein